MNLSSPIPRQYTRHTHTLQLAAAERGEERELIREISLSREREKEIEEVRVRGAGRIVDRMFPSKKATSSAAAAAAAVSSNDSRQQAMCVQADSGSGLVLTTDPKPRLRWTVELHERFVDAVTQLGGPDSTCSSSY